MQTEMHAAPCWSQLNWLSSSQQECMWHIVTGRLNSRFGACMQYSWELWHRSGEYPRGCAAFAFAASAAAAGFRAQRPEASPGGKPGPGGHTTARMRAGIGYSPTEQVLLQWLSHPVCHAAASKARHHLLTAIFGSLACGAASADQSAVFPWLADVPGGGVGGHVHVLRVLQRRERGPATNPAHGKRPRCGAW